MALIINQVTNDISSTSGSVTVNGAAPPSATITRSAKTGAYTVVAGDNGTIIDCTSGTFTVSLTAAATLGSGFNVWILNSGTGVITIDPNGSETVDGLSTSLTLKQGAGYRLVCDGTNFLTIAVKQSGSTGNNATQIGNNATATQNGSVAIGQNASATGGTSISIGGNGSSSASGAAAIALIGTASSNYSVAIGMNSGGTQSQAVTGAGAMALGGSYASGTDSFAAAIGNNTSTYGAQGANSVAIGNFAKATTASSLAIGANTSVITNSRGTAIGYGANCTGYYAVSIGAVNSNTGQGSIAIGSNVLYSGPSATGDLSVAIGGSAKAAQFGRFSYGCSGFASIGDAQYGLMVLRLVVPAGSSGSSLVLTSDGSTPAATNQLVLPTTGMAVTATVLMIGKQTVATKTAAYTSTFTVVNTAGTLTLQGGTWTAVGTASIDATYTAPPTIAVSGTEIRISTGVSSAAATNWVAVVQAAEILF